MHSNNLNIPRKLTKEDKEKLTAAFLEMYQGLVRTNLSRDKTLGQSMYNAMEHEKMYVESKKSNDAVTVYLRQIQAFYAVAQSQQSMTDPNRDKTKQFANDAERAEFARNAEMQTKQGITSMDAIIAQFQKDVAKSQQIQQSAVAVKPAKPIIKTAQQNRDELPRDVVEKPKAPQHGPQMPVNKLASAKQLPMQNMHTARDYGTVKPNTAFKNGTAQIQQKGREFENIKKLQMMLIKQMQYQKAA